LAEDIASENDRVSACEFLIGSTDSELHHLTGTLQEKTRSLCASDALWAHIGQVDLFLLGSFGTGVVSSCSFSGGLPDLSLASCGRTIVQPGS